MPPHRVIVTLPSDLEIVITRSFDLPARLLFEAWTRPEHLFRWMRTASCFLEHCRVDLRVGGTYHLVMRDPTGRTYPTRGEYREIDPPRRLVCTEAYDVEPYLGEVAVVTVTFDEVDGRTVVTRTIRHQSKATRDAHIQAGVEEGSTVAMELLDAVAGLLERQIVLARRLGAPPAMVFDAFVDPAQVVLWWGPKGFTTTTVEMDVRPGGHWKYVMHGPDGTDYPNYQRYHEVVPPERLVYTLADDEHGDGFHVTATFEAIEGGTLLLMVMEFPSAEARDFVVRESGAVEGGQQTVDRLEAHLAARVAGQG